MLECGGAGESSRLPLYPLPLQPHNETPLPTCPFAGIPIPCLSIPIPCHGIPIPCHSIPVPCHSMTASGVPQVLVWAAQAASLGGSGPWTGGQGWVVGVFLSLPPPCLSAHGDAFFRAGTASFCVFQENLREGLGGTLRDTTRSSISLPVVCQMSKGLQSDCRQFLETHISILTHARKGAKTTGSESRRQTEGNNSALCREIQMCLLVFQRKKGHETPGQSSPAEMSGPHLCASPLTLLKEMMGAGNGFT